jgi:hypothetical protein
MNFLVSLIARSSQALKPARTIRNFMKKFFTDDQSELILLLALLLGGLVRLLPVIMAGFPVNDGGMFLVMTEELKANHYLLPAFTGYNQAGIPFAYPPLGFYLTAWLSGILHVSTLEVVRWSPPILSTLSLLPFFMLARETLDSRVQAGLATLLYALAPVSFGWGIMGGGITRAYGLVFLYLTIAFANRLYALPGLKLALAVAASGALAVLSHPETGLQAASACILLLLFRARSRKSLVWAAGVACGVLVFTLPWWGTILATHGLAPFQSAMGTSNDGTNPLVQLVTLQIDGNSNFYNLTIGLGLIGLVVCLVSRAYLLPLWFLLPFVVDPRSAAGISLIPLAMLAAIGFDRVLAPAFLALKERQGYWVNDQFTLRILFAIALYLFFGSAIFGLQLAGASLAESDRETMAWIASNIEPGADFLLLTGEEYSMKDPFQEWFPALTSQHSHTTLQGTEWTLGRNFFPFYGELVSLQHCTNVSCLESWGQRTGIDHNYLVIRQLPEDSQSALRGSLTLLKDSVLQDSKYSLIHGSQNAMIFKYVP